MRRATAPAAAVTCLAAVNVLAPYLLSILVERPERLIYLSSGMHRDANTNLDDIDWTARRWNGPRAYSESKLLVTTLAVARSVPGAQVTIMKQLGHFPMSENPELFLSYLAPVLEEVHARG